MHDQTCDCKRRTAEEALLEKGLIVAFGHSPTWVVFAGHTLHLGIVLIERELKCNVTTWTTRAKWRMAMRRSCAHLSDVVRDTLEIRSITAVTVAAAVEV